MSTLMLIVVVVFVAILAAMLIAFVGIFIWAARTKRLRTPTSGRYDTEDLFGPNDYR